MNKGCYLLIIQVKNDKSLKVGRLGEIKFPQGYYVYVGSAMNNLEKRVRRHLAKNKKIRWHIDYLTSREKVKEVILIYTLERVECDIARELEKHFKPIPKFGCSDCSCLSHLFYSEKFPDLINILKNMGFTNLSKLIIEK